MCQSTEKEETSDTIKTLKTAWIKELRMASENDARSSVMLCCVIWYTVSGVWKALQSYQTPLTQCLQNATKYKGCV